MRRLLANLHYDFIGRRRYAYAVTVALFLPGLVLLLIRGLNYGIEFTGGTLVQVEARQPVDIGAVRSALDAQGLDGAEIQRFGTDRDLVIRARLPESGARREDTGATSALVGTALDQVLGTGKYTVVRIEAVGPKVGGELRRKALTAILLSSLVILAYLAIRFEWRFGAAAVAATAHDVLGTSFFISVLNIEVSLVVVGAVLSVLGISLNETIIIFDRVRENERQKAPGTLAEVLNRSINETLPRTVLTHGTALSTMLTLLLFGGEVIRPFALVMFWGVSTGIFSSMFIAPSVLMFIRRHWPLPGGARAGGPAAQPKDARRKPQPVGSGMATSK
ncbi:MAG: protein translocase subunit SecF [Gemmatimonadales bacterium]